MSKIKQLKERYFGSASWLELVLTILFMALWLVICTLVGLYT